MGAYGCSALPEWRDLRRPAGPHELHLRVDGRLWQPPRPVLEYRRARLVHRIAKGLEAAARRLQTRRSAADARQEPVADLGGRPHGASRNEKTRTEAPRISIAEDPPPS